MSDSHQDRWAKLKARGLLPPDQARQVVPGAVFRAHKDAIHFPKSRLPTAGEPTVHERWVIVVQAAVYGTSERPLTVLVVPCSASGDPDHGDIYIPQGETAFTKPKVTAYTTLVQPCLKGDLMEHLGYLSDSARGLVLGQVGVLLGFREPRASLLAPPRAPLRVNRPAEQAVAPITQASAPAPGEEPPAS